MKCYDGPYGLKMAVSADENVAKIRSVFPVCVEGTDVVSTTFPTGCALGATWNRDLVKEVGEALGNEDRAYGVNVALGPSVNI